MLVGVFTLAPDYKRVLDGYVASPASGLQMGGALALGLQYPVKQAGHWPSSLLQVLVELTELSHSAEQVANTPSLLTCQLHHSVKLRNKHTLFSSSCRDILSTVGAVWGYSHRAHLCIPLHIAHCTLHIPLFFHVNRLVFDCCACDLHLLQHLVHEPAFQKHGTQVKRS